MLTEQEQEIQRKFRGMAPVEKLLWNIQQLREEAKEHEEVIAHQGNSILRKAEEITQLKQALSKTPMSQGSK